MCYENMINFIAVLRHVAFCRYVFLCLSFLVDELGPPVVKKRVKGEVNQKIIFSEMKVLNK